MDQKHESKERSDLKRIPQPIVSLRLGEASVPFRRPIKMQIRVDLSFRDSIILDIKRRPIISGREMGDKWI